MAEKQEEAKIGKETVKVLEDVLVQGAYTEQ
jgi:hypothetical protein